jgi:hypothetical protein
MSWKNSLVRISLLGAAVCVGILVCTGPAKAVPVATPPEPLVAIHVSEVTQALESIAATPPTPTGAGTTGYEWWITTWRYFVAYESLKEALLSDGTPFVIVTDTEIASGWLLRAGGTPRYPILISLAAEAINDSEITPLRNYVNAGGFILVGGAALTRNPDGTTRGDFALASEMGLHMVNASLQNWAPTGGIKKLVDHRLVAHLPADVNYWFLAASADEIPMGVSPGHSASREHDRWQVTASDATVVADGYPFSGSATPYVAYKQYGSGYFIYEAAQQPLIGHGGYDAGMYAYVFFRRAIEWAFETAGLPIIKRSPWTYPYDAAMVIRHDFENWPSAIRSIEVSAFYENSIGVKGDYFFCTGTLREEMADKADVINTLRSAVTNYGATIGSHNGGLKNPVNLSLILSDFDYWHWGPDEALDVASPPGGYADGEAYALASITSSYGDIEGWLSGLTHPRIWVAPAFNSTREISYGILNTLSVLTAGEQKISPFPQFTLSTQTPGLRYSQVSLPTSEWYATPDVIQSLDDHSPSSMQACVDFYHGLGALVNIYSHDISSSSNPHGDYAAYAKSKTRMWAANAVGVHDWWQARSGVTVTPSYSLVGNIARAMASVSGATDADTAIEVALPDWNPANPNDIMVFLDGWAADPDDYRMTDYGVKVKVGTSASFVEVRYPTTPPPPGLSLASLTVNPSSVAGGATSQGTVTLSGAAPAGGAIVMLSADSWVVDGYPWVTVPAGSSTADFTIWTAVVTSPTTANISGICGGVTQTAALQVTVGVKSLTINPATVASWGTTQGTVTLTGPAPAGGVVVNLSASSWVVDGYPTVTVPAGATSANFTIWAAPVSANTPVNITASYLGSSKTAAMTVTIGLNSISFNPASVKGGNTSQGTVTLTGPAPAGGVVVNLSADTWVVDGYPTVTVPAGATSANFTIWTAVVSVNTPATIYGTYAGVTKSNILTVTAAAPGTGPEEPR